MAGSADGRYEVLNPWADIDPIPLRSISPRLDNLAGKKIGLFMNSKIAAPTMLAVVERTLKERVPSVLFTRFERIPNLSVAETPDKAKYEEWLKGLDAVIFSHGD